MTNIYIEICFWCGVRITAGMVGLKLFILGTLVGEYRNLGVCSK